LPIEFAFALFNWYYRFVSDVAEFLHFVVV